MGRTYLLLEDLRLELIQLLKLVQAHLLLHQHLRRRLCPCASARRLEGLLLLLLWQGIVVLAAIIVLPGGVILAMTDKI